MAAAITEQEGKAVMFMSSTPRRAVANDPNFILKQKNCSETGIMRGQSWLLMQTLEDTFAVVSFFPLVTRQ